MIKTLSSIWVGLLGFTISFAYAETSQEYLFNTATAYWKSQAIYLAAKLNIADQLKNGPVDTKDLARILSVNPNSLYRVLRTLATEGVLEEVDGNKFVLSERGKCLRTDLPCSMRNAIVMYGSEQFKAWSNLDKAMTESTTAFEKTYNAPVFQYFKEYPESAQVFHLAMKELGSQIYPQSEIVTAYPFHQFKTIVDVGGGNGSFLQDVLSQAPQSKGIVFDLQPVAQDRSQKMGITRLSGDFFQSVPQGGDLYILKRVVHDWDDSQAQRILSQVKKSMNSAGKLILIELVIEKNSTSARSLPHWIDLHMMVMTGGRERSSQDFADLLKKSGFRLNRIIPTQAKLSIIEASPVL